MRVSGVSGVCGIRSSLDPQIPSKGWGCPGPWLDPGRGWGSVDFRTGGFSRRQAQDAGVEEDLSQMIDCGAESVTNASLAAVDEEGGFGLGVFLEDDATDEGAVDDGEVVETLLDIEDKDNAVFEGFDDAVGGPAAGNGLSEDGGPPTDQHGSEEVAAQDLLGAAAV